ncbi:autotransporter domain-containing protein [Pseudomonas nicosulfuronedens]|nr:autotransporter outer membrane beta-barrel domain-containing protein [Pseudomonas nicosulfuronedens]MDH1010154.1 autotransporter domain-containing protein [Pseudomonas nicosulfuronedens]MDH1980170.1 autotransporter domain-containing protein [Pseudomonas nicosulfuronedens]MDH2025389.1 autotransporter domain-containing protein [Pseudomonas nicosulfuronedens]
MGDPKAPEYSTWNLDSEQKNKIQKAIDYWATVIQPNPGTSPAIVNVGTYKGDNAGGISDTIELPDKTATTVLQAFLTGQGSLIDSLTFGSHAQFQMGSGLTYDTLPYSPTQQPLGSKGFDINATALHELAHGLGINTNVTNKKGDNSDTPYFNEALIGWEQHLRDDNGNPAHPNQVVLCTGCNNDYDPDGFDLRKDQGYFTGDNVTEVLDGAMPGVPVKILGVEGDVDDNYMSHSELKNSLMSHQNYRNYTTFMEAELAALQDMGYQIDRRNFFGYSVYGNGQMLYNQNGYFKRNETGTAYLTGAYNETPLGIGLHVYGSDNLIYQQADLLTRGAGAVGVRIDGQGNALIVEPGTRIHADGLNGQGILFAYGKDHTLVLRGDVQAMGENGVGARFSFGQNMLGSLGASSEYRGSYFQFQNNKVLDNPLPELMGALVDDVDISGRLAGTDAAIRIDDSALVNQINILAGAQLEGGIYSDYNRWGGVEQRFTQLNFGLLNDGQGRALDQTDPNFRMTYDGDIQGIRSLVLNLRGGETSLNSQNNQLYAVNVEEGATLRGNGLFQLNPNGEFVNRGTVAPGNSLGSITVDGDYRQTDTGQLLVEVNDKRQHDSLLVTGNADLAGRLTVAPVRGWYSPQWTVSSSQLLQSTSTTGSFDAVESLPVSPTLSLLATPKADGSYLLNFERSSDAYAQYALSQNGREVGEALSETASEVKAGDTDRQKLYTALDFSAADGSTIGRALEQLSPSAYSAMLASSLQREQQVADAISAREPGKLRDDEWQAFIQPFGGNTRQNSDSHTVGFNSDSSGVIFGAETAATSDGNLIVGLHGAASKQKVNLKDPLHGDGNTTALELGVHARYAADPMAGSYMLGSARIGYETGELKRKLDFADYSAENKADWTGKSASLVGGGGYRFKLNENVSLGPIATLTYTNLWRDGTHEKGADGSTLKLKSQQFDSLRSSIGLNSAMKFPLDGGKAIKAEGQITWNHELLDTDLIQDATFANYQGVKFKSKNTVMDRDSMGLRGSVRYQLSENVDIGAGVASDLFRTGYNSVSGNLSLDWRF